MGFNECPGSVLGVGSRKHLLDCSKILIVLAVAAPVVIRDLPGGGRVFLKLLESALLFVLGNMQEKLYDYGSVIGKLPFE